MNKINDFLKESNAIEGIFDYDEEAQREAALKFFRLEEIIVDDVVELNKVLQPDAKLRDQVYISDVVVGTHRPPPSGPVIRGRLEDLLIEISDMTIHPYDAHARYEILHPFTDGNGRTGRMIWAWQMVRSGYQLERLFLQQWYYQSLSHYRK